MPDQDLFAVFCALVSDACQQVIILIDFECCNYML